MTSAGRFCCCCLPLCRDRILFRARRSGFFPPARWMDIRRTPSVCIKKKKRKKEGRHVHQKTALPCTMSLNPRPVINESNRVGGVCVKVYLKSASALCRPRKRAGCRSITACRSEQVRRMRKGKRIGWWWGLLMGGD